MFFYLEGFSQTQAASRSGGDFAKCMAFRSQQQRRKEINSQSADSEQIQKIQHIQQIQQIQQNQQKNQFQSHHLFLDSVTVSWPGAFRRVF